MTEAYYPAIIERGADGFGVFFPDLPGCTSAGDTVQDAARNAEDAAQTYVDVTAEYGEALPAPTDIDLLVIEPDIDEAARVLVRVELPGKDA